MKVQVVETTKNATSLAGKQLGALISKSAAKNKKLQGLMMLRAIVNLVRDPNRTMYVFELDDAITSAATPQQRQQFIDQLKADPEYERMFEERYLYRQPLSDLAQYAPGTLGYAYYKHMTDNGFTPDFYPMIEVKDDATYLKLRLRQTHDIWHILTGYNTTVVGEVALQAFYAAQVNGLLASLIVGGGIFHIALTKNAEVGNLIEAVAEGYRRGATAKKFAPVKWEQMWGRSLEEVRREYNIPAGQHAQLNLITEPTALNEAVAA